jgi:hypothetical protein
MCRWLDPGWDYVTSLSGRWHWPVYNIINNKYAKLQVECNIFQYLLLDHSTYLLPNSNSMQCYRLILLMTSRLVGHGPGSLGELRHVNRWPLRLLKTCRWKCTHFTTNHSTIVCKLSSRRANVCWGSSPDYSQWSSLFDNLYISSRPTLYSSSSGVTLQVSPKHCLCKSFPKIFFFV